MSLTSFPISTVRVRDINADNTPSPSDFLIIDGDTVRRATVAEVVDAGMSETYDPEGVKANVYDRANHTGLDAYTPYFPVSVLGATGDGSTDDRTALFNANAAAAAAGAGLLIEPGIFLVGSDLTLTVPVKFAGGKLKPSDGVAILIISEIIAGANHIFDTSLGGVIEGSPRLPSGSVWAEWWGANPVGDCNPAIMAVVAFLRQRSVSGGLGGIWQLEQGDYGKSGTPAVIDFTGFKIRGRGEWVSSVYGDGVNLMFDWVGAISSGGSVYAIDIEGCILKGANTNPKPTGGKIIRAFGIQQFLLRDVTIMNIYQGVETIACEGPLDKHMDGITWIAPNTKPAISGSYLWYAKGVSTATAGVDTGINHSFKVTNNRGGGIGIQTCVIIDGADQLGSSNNHWWGGDEEVLKITSNGSPSYNLFFTADVFEAINGGAAYAASVVSSQAAKLNAIEFLGGQMLNGVAAAFYVSGTAPEDITAVAVDLRQIIGNGAFLENGKNLELIACTATDININEDLANHFFAIIGNGGVGPAGVTMTDFRTRIADFAGTAAYAIDLRNGTGIQVNHGRLRGWGGVPILMASGLGAEVRVHDVDTGLVLPSIASASTIDPPIGVDAIKVTGTTPILNIAATALNRGRRLRVILEDGAPVHSGGNIAPAGRTSWTAPGAGSVIYFEYDADIGAVYEASRNAA